MTISITVTWAHLVGYLVLGAVFGVTAVVRGKLTAYPPTAWLPYLRDLRWHRLPNIVVLWPLWLVDEWRNR